MEKQELFIMLMPHRYGISSVEGQLMAMFYIKE